MKQSITIQVFGKVQGVWFRASTQQKAQELGIFGTVRNLPDGSVFIEAEGEPNRLQTFTNWCRQGTPLAQVTQLEVKAADNKGFNDFQIIR